MIQHVTVQIPPAALEDCVTFYEVLGFVPAPVPEGIEGRAVWLQAPESASRQQVHLMLGEEAAPAPGHFALVCPDYEATLDALRSAGHEPEPRREHWGSPRSYVRDPAGNLVELMAFAPGGAQPGGE